MYTVLWNPWDWRRGRAVRINASASLEHCKERSWGLYTDDPPFRSITLCKPYDAQRPPLTMSDDDDWFPTPRLTAPPFSFPLSIPQETPTDFPASTPSYIRTSLEISPPTLTKTDDPTRTGGLLSSFRTPDNISPTYGGPTSPPLSFWSPITIHSLPLSSPRPTHNSLTTTPSFTRTRYTHSPRSSSTSSRSSLTTSGSSFKTSSLSSTSSHSRSTTSSTTPSSRTSASFPPPVTQTTFPSFSSSSDVRIIFPSYRIPVLTHETHPELSSDPDFVRPYRIDRGSVYRRYCLRDHSGSSGHFMQKALPEAGQPASRF